MQGGAWREERAQAGLFEKLPSVGGTINIHNFHAYHDCFQHLGLPELTLLEITAGRKRQENDSLVWEYIYSSSQHSLDGTILHTCFTLSSRASLGIRLHFPHCGIMLNYSSFNSLLSPHLCSWLLSINCLHVNPWVKVCFWWRQKKTLGNSKVHTLLGISALVRRSNPALINLFYLSCFSSQDTLPHDSPHQKIFSNLHN